MAIFTIAIEVISFETETSTKPTESIRNPELNLETRLHDIGTPSQDSEELEITELENQIKELEANGINSFYCEDGSNACNWDVADNVEEIEE